MAPRRGEMIVDFCAGAGGKTLALGAMMRSTGRLYAFDVSDRRLAKLKPRLARSGLSNVNPVLIDSEHDAKIKRLAGKIDRVLVDAPCSRPRHVAPQSGPEVASVARESSRNCAEAAFDPASAARLVKTGGRLVYATCSMLEAENEDVVAAVPRSASELRLVPARDVLAEQRIDLDTGDYLSLLAAQARHRRLLRRRAGALPTPGKRRKRAEPKPLKQLARTAFSHTAPRGSSAISASRK